MQDLFRFLKKYHFVFVFLLLEGIAALLIIQNSHFQQSSILAWSNKQAGRLYTISDAITSYFGLAKTNRLLSEENARLREQIENAYIEYSTRIFFIGDTVYKQQYNYTESKIISNSHNKRNNYLILNKGSLQGIKPDMAVISTNGIVGNVLSVSENFSSVMSVLHSDSRHSVKVKRTNSVGTLMWEGGDFEKGIVENVPSSYPLKVNDTIITSGYSLDFPEGIFVGTVASFEQNQSTGFYKVTVKFAIDYRTLKYVYVIKDLYKTEKEQLIEPEEGDDE